MAEDRIPVGQTGSNYQNQILGTDKDGYVRKVRVDQDGELMVELSKPSGEDIAGRQSLNTVFGDKIVGIRKPSIASQFVYPVPSEEIKETKTGSAGYTVDNAMLKVSTGVTPNSTIFLKSRKALRYTPGYEAYLNYTFLLSTPVVGTYVFSGLGDEVNHFSIGYNTTGIFGIRHRRDGVDSFIAQSEFNKDKLDGSGESGIVLNPSFGNIFRISYGFLGFANITFSVLDKTNKWVAFHIIEYANKYTQTHITNTYLPIFANMSNGSTSNNIYAHFGSVEAGVVDGGGVDVTGRSFSAKIDSLVTGTNTTIALFHNKATYATKVNMIPSLLTLVTASAEGTQNVNIALYKIKLTDITIVGTWLNVNLNNSTMEYSLNSTINYAGIANWEFLLPINLAKSDSRVVEVSSFNLLLYPDEYAVFVANGNSTVNLAIRWRELF